MSEFVFKEGTLPYRRLTAACGILQALDRRNVEYRVEDTYLDFSSGTMWTTIIGYENGGKYQALNRYGWDDIVNATSSAEVVIACHNVLAERDYWASKSGYRRNC